MWCSAHLVLCVVLPRVAEKVKRPCPRECFLNFSGFHWFRQPPPNTHSMGCLSGLSDPRYSMNSPSLIESYRRHIDFTEGGFVKGCQLNKRNIGVKLNSKAEVAPGKMSAFCLEENFHSYVFGEQAPEYILPMPEKIPANWQQTFCTKKEITKKAVRNLIQFATTTKCKRREIWHKKQQTIKSHPGLQVP